MYASLLERDMASANKAIVAISFVCPSWRLVELGSSFVEPSFHRNTISNSDKGPGENAACGYALVALIASRPF